jgi:predicted DNA-binding antitoxin AbrB/MazE fold protein
MAVTVEIRGDGYHPPVRHIGNGVLKRKLSSLRLKEGTKMKKVLIVVVVFFLLYLVFKSGVIQNCTDRLVESNVSHEQKQLQNFLSQ